MKYYLIDSSIDVNGATAQAIFVFDTKNEAVAQFHSTISYKMISDSVASALVMVINEMGGIEKSEKYIKDVPAPEEPETVEE